MTSAEAAYRKLRLGATAVQLYTGLVYHGPGLVKEILAAWLRCWSATVTRMCAR